MIDQPGQNMHAQAAENSCQSAGHPTANYLIASISVCTCYLPNNIFSVQKPGVAFCTVVTAREETVPFMACDAVDNGPVQIGGFKQNNITWPGSVNGIRGNLQKILLSQDGMHAWATISTVQFLTWIWIFFFPVIKDQVVLKRV